MRAQDLQKPPYSYAISTTPRHKLQPDEKTQAQETFLKAFSQTAIVGASARKANVDRSTVYQWLESDAAFRAKFEQAEQDANDRLREEILRRGVEGVQEITTVTDKRTLNTTFLSGMAGVLNLIAHGANNGVAGFTVSAGTGAPGTLAANEIYIQLS